LNNWRLKFSNALFLCLIHKRLQLLQKSLFWNQIDTTKSLNIHSHSLKKSFTVLMVVKSSNALSVCSFGLHFHSYYILNVIAHINSPKINVKAWIFPKILLNILTKVSKSFSWIEAGKHLKRSNKKQVCKQPQRYADEHDIELICLDLWVLWRNIPTCRLFLGLNIFNDLPLC